MTVSPNVSSILQQIAALNADELAELRSHLESQPTNGSPAAPQIDLPTTSKDEAAFK